MTPPLLPNTDFATVEYFTSDMAYCLANPTFDGLTQYLGHNPKLLDNSLDPNGVISRVAALTDPFKVTQVGNTGSVVEWVAGLVRDLDANTKSIAAGQLNLPSDSYCYIYIAQNTSTGVVSVQYVSAATDILAIQKLPVLKTLLAQVITVSTNITQITDLRAVTIRNIVPPQSAVRVFGGQSQTDWTATQGQIVSGIIVCRNANIPAGITIQVDRYVKFICSGAWTNNGTINQIRPANGALYAQPTIVKNQSLDSATSLGVGAGASGSPYEPVLGSYSGSGGGQGGCFMLPDDSNAYISFARQAAGNSGSTLIVEAFGIITQNGVIDLSGGNAGQTGQLGTSPIAGTFAGNGGGSGGYFSATSKTSVLFTSTGSTSIKGGNASNGAVFTGTSTLIASTNGGFGGSGGLVDIFCSGVINTTGHTFLLTGGTNGTPAWNNNAVTLLAPGVYLSNSLNWARGEGGLGGAFAGLGGYTTISITGNAVTTTYNPPAVGQVRTFGFTPIF